MAAIDKTELTQVVLGLQFWVTSEHFQSNSKLKVKCRGRIPSVYQAESDTLIVGEHDGPQHKVLQATSGATATVANNLKGTVYRVRRFLSASLVSRFYKPVFHSAICFIFRHFGDIISTL